jgi:hypothetical protein
MPPPLVSKLLDRVKILKNGQMFLRRRKGGPGNERNFRAIDITIIHSWLCSDHKTNY